MHALCHEVRRVDVAGPVLAISQTSPVAVNLPFYF